jgi:hypothetical protein
MNKSFRSENLLTLRKQKKGNKSVAFFPYN